MRNGPGTFAKLGVRRAAAAALALSSALVVAATPPRPGEVAVTITDMRNAEGMVLACMTSDPDRFPRCRGDANAYRVRVKATASEQVRLVFRDVKPGRYAIALLHDENDNGKADRALGMMPKEGFGFSRDAPVKMAPPKFEAAAFDFSGKATALTIKMRYML